MIAAMTTAVTVPRMMTIAEAAKTFHVSEKSIRRAIHADELNAYVPGMRNQLVAADEVASWIRSKPYRNR